MKNRHQPLAVEQTLFSELQLEEMEKEVPAVHDKILEARQNSNFSEDTLSQQEHVQVVVKHQIYPTDDVKAAAKKYFHGDSLAADVWANKYALKDSDGNIYEMTPDDMHHRIAREIARIERKYPNPLTEEEVFEVLKDFKYIVPQGSPMTGIGNDFQISSLSNCFVIGNKGQSDSLYQNRYSHSLYLHALQTGK